MRRWLFALLLLASCGYRFTTPNASLPGGVRTVRVALLQNRTAEPNLDALVTQALREEFARTQRLGGDAAEASLTGAVIAVSNAPLLASPGRLPIYRLNVTVQLKLEKDGAALSQVSFTTSEEYTSGPDALLSEGNRGAALRRVVELIAREATERLATSW